MLNKAVKTNVKTAANDVRDEIDSISAQATRMARELLESAQEELEHMSGAVTDEIRANPWRSGLIALGVGVAIGALLRRS